VIDLYQIHWPIPEEDIEEGWSAFAELTDQQLVRHIGVSNFDVEQLRRIQQIAPVETLQPQYSLIERGIERAILPYTSRSMSRCSSAIHSLGRSPVAAANRIIRPYRPPIRSTSARICCYDSNGRCSTRGRWRFSTPCLAALLLSIPQLTARWSVWRSAWVASNRCP
jgi:Aldo/keto reductase family